MKTKKTISTIFGAILLTLFVSTSTVSAAEPEVKSRFYDFSEQLIDGQVLKPAVIYTSSREKVRFGRLLRLKRDFMGRNIQQTAREIVFK